MMPDQPPICDYEGSDYQKVFWDQGERAYEDQVEAIALKRLLPAYGKRMLEIGAGAGRNTARYKNFEQVVLLDYSRTQLQQAQDRLGKSDCYVYVAADAYRLPFAESSFDATTMIRTLHHISNVPQVLHQVHKVLQGNSIFILEYPNKKNLKAILRYLFGRQPWSPFSPEPVEFAALNFDFQPRSVRNWLNQNGFAIERQLTVSHFRIGFLKRTIPTKILVNMDSLAQITGNWWQLSPSVFIRARHQGQAQPITPNLVFRCPECLHYPLDEDRQSVECPACGRGWAIRDGIYDFREPLIKNGENNETLKI